MRRRSLLAGAGAAIPSLAGCLSGGDTEREYARCAAPFVPRSEIPHDSAARDEVEAALETGRYETRETLVYPELVGEDSRLWVAETNRYYEHRVESGWLTEALTFDAVTPTRESSGELKLSNQTGSSLDVSVTVTDEAGETAVDETLSVAPADAIDAVDAIEPGADPGTRAAAAELPGLAFADALRTYEISIAVADGPAVTETVAVGPWFEYYWVQLSETGILAGTVRERDEFFAEHVSSVAGDRAACQQPPNGWPERATASNWD